MILIFPLSGCAPAALQFQWHIANLPFSYYFVAMLRTVTVKLRERVLAEIEAEARARHTTRSAVVRARLERARTQDGSLWDRIRDLVIVHDTAPVDLAANKARLRGYGRSRRR